MAQQYPELSDKHTAFIAQQKLFFVGTAADGGRINVSPKGTDSLRVLSPNRIVWLNLTGSGNETAAHLAQNDRMTIMFCAFDGDPKILRVYGKAKAIHPRDPQWEELSSLFEPSISARQLVDLEFDLVMTSCGFGVPLYDYQQEREHMDNWNERKGEEGIKKYWQDKNQISIDGLPTYILDEEDSAS